MHAGVQTAKIDRSPDASHKLRLRTRFLTVGSLGPTRRALRRFAVSERRSLTQNINRLLNLVVACHYDPYAILHAILRTSLPDILLSLNPGQLAMVFATINATLEAAAAHRDLESRRQAAYDAKAALESFPGMAPLKNGREGQFSTCLSFVESRHCYELVDVLTLAATGLTPVRFTEVVESMERLDFELCRRFAPAVMLISKACDTEQEFQQGLRLLEQVAARYRHYEWEEPVSAVIRNLTSDLVRLMECLHLTVQTEAGLSAMAAMSTLPPPRLSRCLTVARRTPCPIPKDTFPSMSLASPTEGSFSRNCDCLETLLTKWGANSEPVSVQVKSRSADADAMCWTDELESIAHWAQVLTPDCFSDGLALASRTADRGVCGVADVAFALSSDSRTPGALAENSRGLEELLRLRKQAQIGKYDSYFQSLSLLARELNSAQFLEALSFSLRLAKRNKESGVALDLFLLIARGSATLQDLHEKVSAFEEFYVRWIARCSEYEVGFKIAVQTSLTAAALRQNLEALEGLTDMLDQLAAKNIVYPARFFDADLVNRAILLKKSHGGFMLVHQPEQSHAEWGSVERFFDGYDGHTCVYTESALVTIVDRPELVELHPVSE
jgi:hypothetical protein